MSPMQSRFLILYQVLGYFKNCYTPNNNKKDRNVSNCIIKCNWNIIKHENRSLGILYIREYYPEYKITIENIKNSYWGKK